MKFSFSETIPCAFPPVRAFLANVEECASRAPDAPSRRPPIVEAPPPLARDPARALPRFPEGAPMTEFDAAPKIPPHRARRMFAALLGGVSPDAIGAEENLPTETVERALSDELGRRWAPTVAEFAKIQIARLESYCLQLMDRVEAGELAAVDRALKIWTGSTATTASAAPPRPSSRTARRTASGCWPSSTPSRRTSPTTNPAATRDRGGGGGRGRRARADPTDRRPPEAQPRRAGARPDGHDGEGLRADSSSTGTSGPVPTRSRRRETGSSGSFSPAAAPARPAPAPKRCGAGRGPSRS